MQETRVQSLGREDPLEKDMVTHSSICVWEIPRTEEPGRPQSTGCREVDTTERPAHTPWCSCLQSLVVCLSCCWSRCLSRCQPCNKQSQVAAGLRAVRPRPGPSRKPLPLQLGGLGPPWGPLPALGDGGWDAVEAPRSWLT